MKTINIHQAKAHLSRLVEEAAQGSSFIIAKAGRPMVKVVPLRASEKPAPKRLDFLKGAFSIPEDFDTLGGEAIERLFRGGQ